MAAGWNCLRRRLTVERNQRGYATQLRLRYWIVAPPLGRCNSATNGRSSNLAAVAATAARDRTISRVRAARQRSPCGQSAGSAPPLCPRPWPSQASASISVSRRRVAGTPPNKRPASDRAWRPQSSLDTGGNAAPLAEGFDQQYNQGGVVHRDSSSVMIK